MSRPRLLSEEIRSTYYLLVGTIGVMIIVLVLSYLYVSSQRAAKGYLLKQLQLDYEDLTSESKTLDTQLIEVQSITNIDQAEPTEDMEKPTNEDYSFMGTEENIARR